MKRFDEETKKLIKNVAALITSALVLIAATVAWFATNSQAGVGSVGSTITAGSFTIKYYKADVSDDVCTVGSTQLGSATKASLTWTEVNNIDVDPLFPGEYNAFKIEVTIAAAGAPNFIMKNITATPSAAESTAYDSVYVAATAYSSGGTQLDSACDVMSELITTDSNTGVSDIAPLTLSSMPANTTFIIYLDVGIPGEDITGTHDALRETGAEISIATVTVE